MIRIMCPQCHAKVEQAVMPADGIVQCPSCGKRLRVPASKPTAGAAPAAPRTAPPPRTEPHPVPAEQPRPRRHEHELDDHASRKGKRKKHREPSGGGNATMLIVGGVVAAVVIIGIAVLLFVILGDDSKKPIAQNTPPPPMQPMIDPETGQPFAPGGPPPGKARYPEPNKPNAPPREERPRDNAATARNDGPPGSTEQPKDFGGVSAGNEGAGSDVYPYLLKSAVFIVVLVEVQTPMGPRFRVAAGSGSLIDRKNRLVLTNHHVAGNAKEVVVFFPVYRDGKLIVEKERFMNQFKSKEDVITAQVLGSDMRCDLCLLQLKRLPDGVESLPLSRAAPQPGQRVHSIGNPGASDGLWVYTSGTVRQVYHKRWRSQGGGEVFDHDADVVETQSPTNQGDSGGPLVNDRGELVGVTQGADVSAQLVSFFVDVSEVRRFIDKTVEARLGSKWASDARPPLQIASRGAGGGNVTELVKNLENPDAGKRAKAAESLGEMGENARVAIPGLLKALKDQDELTRRTAAAALGKIGLPAKSDVPLLAAALKDPSLEVRQFAVSTLAKMGADARSATPGLVDALKDDDATVRQAAARALGKLGPDVKGTAGRELIALLDHADKDTRLGAAEGLLGILGTPDDMPTLQKMMKAKDAEVRATGVKALAKLGKDAKPALAELLDGAKNGDPEMRKAVLTVLAVLTGADAKPSLSLVSAALKDGDKETKQLALQVVVKLGADAQSIAQLVKDVMREPEHRKEAIAALGKIGANSRVTVPALLECLKDSDEAVRDAALKTIGEIGPPAAAAANDLINLFDNAREIKNQQEASAYLDKVAVVVARLGRPAVPSLIKALQEDNAAIRWGACKALGAMGPIGKDAERPLKQLAAAEPNLFIAQEAEKALRKVTAR